MNYTDYSIVVIHFLANELEVHQGARVWNVVSVLVFEQQVFFRHVFKSENRIGIRQNGSDVTCLFILGDEFECNLALSPLFSGLRIGCKDFILQCAVIIHEVCLKRLDIQSDSKMHTVDVEI